MCDFYIQQIFTMWLYKNNKYIANKRWCDRSSQIQIKSMVQKTSSLMLFHSCTLVIVPPHRKQALTPINTDCTTWCN